MCVGKALSHNFATVTLPVSEAPNWLGAGNPSALGVTVAHPTANWKGKKHTGRVHPKAASWAVTRRVTDLLDDAQSFCVRQLLELAQYRSSRPLPRGGLGGVAFLGATGETDSTLLSTRARNLAG